MNTVFRKQVFSTNNKKGDVIEIFSLNEKHHINRLKIARKIISLSRRSFHSRILCLSLDLTFYSKINRIKSGLEY